MMRAEFLPSFEPKEMYATPEDSYFVYTQEWLREISLQYAERQQKATSMGESDQLLDITVVVGDLRTAWQLTKKLYVASRQYKVLCRKVIAPNHAPGAPSKNASHKRRLSGIRRAPFFAARLSQPNVKNAAALIATR